jgi:hypothetical protein
VGRKVAPQSESTQSDSKNANKWSFRLPLQFVHRDTGIESAALEIPELDAEIILRVLEALEKDRGIGIATRVLAIPLKRANSRVREYLTREGVRITQCDHAIEKLVNYMVMNAASGA